MNSTDTELEINGPAPSDVDNILLALIESRIYCEAEGDLAGYFPRGNVLYLRSSQYNLAIKNILDALCSIGGNPERSVLKNL